MKKCINQMEPWIGKEEQEAVSEYLKSGGWLMEFKKTREFEEMIAKYTGAKYCSVVCNGTVSLFIALKACIEYKGKVLILREAKSYTDGANIGQYDIPGGRMKPGESVHKVLKREVLEETGLKIDILSPLKVSEWFPVVGGQHWQVVGVFFRCQAFSDKVILSIDHDKFEWIEPKNYKEYPIINNLSSVFEEYLKKNKNY